MTKNKIRLRRRMTTSRMIERQKNYGSLMNRVQSRKSRRLWVIVAFVVIMTVLISGLFYFYA